MADETERTIFEISVEAEQAKSELAKVKQGMVEVDLTSKKTGETLDEVLQKLGTLSKEEAQYLKEMQSAGYAPGAIGDIMISLRRSQYDASERLGPMFKETRREIEGAKISTRQFSGQMGVLERATRSASSSWVRYIGRLFGAYMILRQVRAVAHEWSEAHTEMDEALADFSWRVSSAETDVAAYRDTLLQASQISGVGVGAIAGPQAQRQPLGNVARAAAATQIFGKDTQYWLREGTTNLDALAVGMKEAGVTADEFAGVIQYLEDVSDMWNISQKESIGLLAGLMRQLDITDRGALGLVKVLSKLYEENQALQRLGVAAPVRVGPSGERIERPLTEVMGDISRLPRQAQIEIANLVGIQSELFLETVAGWGEISRAINEATNDVGTFGEAFDAHADSMQSKTERVSTAWSNLLGRIGDTGLIKDSLDIVTMALEGWAMLIDEISKGFASLQESLGLPSWLKPGGGIELLAGLYKRPELPGPTPEEKALVAAPTTTNVPPALMGPAAWQDFRAQRLPEGINIADAVREMERIINEDFIGVFQTASGELVEVTKAQIDAERQLTLVLDENGRKAVDVYQPAWTQALSNLKEELKDTRINLDRLRDITPAQFDIAMKTRLPMWEARLQQIPGFSEQAEWQNFFVGQQDVGRRQLATQTAMAYTLQDILDAEKKQLEGQWNIPAGAVMRVPLQSLDLMRWMQQGGGPAGEGFPMGPTSPNVEAVTQAGVNLTGSATNLNVSASNLSGSAASLTEAALKFGAKIYGGVPVEPGVAKEAALEGGVRASVHKQAVAAYAGGGGKVEPVHATIPVTTIIQLDGRQIAKVVEERHVSNIRMAGRGRAGGLRP